MVLIREVILENFMSYEYARVPVKPGVNVICGPNGSGKSSILLGISVALGQSYTERSKKLSDLIRWGKDQARVTIALDNSRKGGRRPIQRINKDYILLTRILRLDGKYWFELDNKAATKGDVVRLLSRLGVDPDNMLVIMHQNMVEQFTVIHPQEKLKMVEAAVGLEPYRQNVIEAQHKLSRVLSEEESVGNLLASAEQTLRYWREQYDRYQQKKQLRIKRRFLEREVAWAEVLKTEQEVSDLKEKIKENSDKILFIDDEIKTVNGQLIELLGKLEEQKSDRQAIFEELYNLGCEKAKNELTISLANQTLEDIRFWIEASQEGMKDCVSKIERLEKMYHNPNSAVVTKQVIEVKKSYENFEESLVRQFILKRDETEQLIKSSTVQLIELDAQIKKSQTKSRELFTETDNTINEITECKIKTALMSYQQKMLKENFETQNKNLQDLLEDLNEAVIRAEEKGPRLVVLKTKDEILDEMRITDGHLAALTDVSDDIEGMYESYSKLYLELKEKANLVAENREKTLEEVKIRMEAWKSVIEGLLNQVNLRYQIILSEAQAAGEVRLTNDRDIEDAGLEILVGFKGSTPVALDAYTQSGGERSTATMAFLLALQQHVQSPFRAVDEYDIHMDPKNREIIANVLISSVRGSDAQYVAITPSQVTFMKKDVHFITVQNVKGTSLIKEVV